MNPNPEKAISQNNPEVGANNSMANAFEKLGVSPASFPAEPTREVVPEKPTRNKKYHKTSSRNHSGPNHKADRTALSLELAEINKIRDRIKRDLARFEEDKNIANQEIAEIKTRIKEAEASGQPDAVIRWNARLEKANDLLGMVEKTAPSVDPISDVAIRRELYEYRRARQKQEGADSRINKGNDPKADEEYQQAQSKAFEIKEKIEALLKKRDENMAIFNPAQNDSIGNIRTEGSALMREVQPEADPEELIRIAPEGSVSGSLELAQQEGGTEAIDQGGMIGSGEDARIEIPIEIPVENAEEGAKPELPPLESPVEDSSKKTSEHLLRVEARAKEVSARQKEIAEKYDIASIEEKIELEKESASLVREKEKFAESTVSREAEPNVVSEKSAQATADDWREEAVKNWEETSGKKVPDLELEHTPEEHDAILPVPTEVVGETVVTQQERQKGETRPVLNAEQIIALNEKNRVTREKILARIANEEEGVIERMEKSRMSSGLVRNTVIATALLSILVVSVLPKITNDFSSHRESRGRISQTVGTASEAPAREEASALEIAPPTAEEFEAALKSAENANNHVPTAESPTETPAQAVSAGELFNQPLITDFAPPEQVSSAIPEEKGEIVDGLVSSPLDTPASEQVAPTPARTMSTGETMSYFETSPHGPSSQMSQKVVPSNTAELAQIEAYGDKVFLDDMDALFGIKKGPLGIFGRTSGIDSPHMKNPDSGFLGKTVNEILSAKPDTEVVGGAKTFGINNAEAHTKMVNYINNVRRVSGVGLNTSEKLADFVRNAAIVNAKLPK